MISDPVHLNCHSMMNKTLVKIEDRFISNRHFVKGGLIFKVFLSEFKHLRHPVQTLHSSPRQTNSYKPD